MGMLSDNAKSEISKAVKQYLRKYRIEDMQTEPMHPNQNPAETRILDVKNATGIMMDSTNSPSHLWCLCMQHAADIINHISHVNLKHKTPHEVMYGVTPNISSLIQFHWYQPVLYFQKNNPFPESKEKIGYFIGVARNVGDALTFKILTEKDQVISRSVVCPCEDDKNANLRMLENNDDVKEQSRHLIPLVTKFHSNN